MRASVNVWKGEQETNRNAEQESERQLESRARYDWNMQQERVRDDLKVEQEMAGMWSKK
jgi:hypothetical protein